MSETFERLMLCGDTHGDMPHLRWLIEQADALDADGGTTQMVQLGDFGFVWSSMAKVQMLSEYLEAHDRDLWFIDGNHEGFDLLGSLANLNATEPCPIAPRVTYLPRGATFEWAGKRFLTFGGAVSVDQAARTPGIDWWPEEVITDRQVQRVIDSGATADVVLSHDVPWVAGPLSDHLMDLVDYKLDRASKGNRTRLAQVVEAVGARMVIHGHYHLRYEAKAHGVALVGLGCNYHRHDSYTVLHAADQSPCPSQPRSSSNPTSKDVNE
jgi:predicted phosphodiesterase